MTSNINETNQVEEQPATYNRNFQLLLIGGLVFVVVVMVYASLFRSGPADSRIEEQVQQEIRKQALSNPEQEFRDQIKSQEQRLQKQRERDLSEQRDYIDEKTDAVLQNNEQVLQELLSGAKSALESWDENETVRVRQSRQADFNFEFFAGAPETASHGAPGPDSGFLQSERSILAALRQEVEPEQQPALSANLGTDFKSVPSEQQPALFATLGTDFKSVPPSRVEYPALPRSPGSPAAGDAAAQENPRSFNLAGYPESDLSQPPDTEYALLSIGSVMHAKLDQKIISDYAGPYRCRIEQNVMDVTQRHVLIPAGSLCTGQVLQTGSAHPNRVINNRMALSVRWIVRPDGTKIKFVSQALDHEGIGALKGKTNYHFLARFGGAAAFALLSSETARADYSSGGSGATFESDVGQALREGGADLVAPYAGLVPTQTLDYGQKLRLFVSEDIYIRPWRAVYQHLLTGQPHTFSFR